MKNTYRPASSTYAEISRENARSLAESIGGLAKFADRVGMADTQVSQILGKNPVRNIGVKMARRIEEAFQKPLGWIDQRHEEIEVGILSDAAIDPLLSTELRILQDKVNKAVACLRAYGTASEPDQRHLISVALTILEEGSGIHERTP